jgi:hypothetical protein
MTDLPPAKNNTETRRFEITFLKKVGATRWPSPNTGWRTT